MSTLAEKFPDETFLLVWLPIARAEQYYHAMLREAGWLTFEVTADVEEQRAALDPALADLPAFDSDPELEAALRRFDLPP